ncbi:DNA internalization-related competence protein ComEC/Rec2 [Fundicoccus ignavus]|uniref:DNA internalization-related competence protein ComEC/Rec2 n=1 Tax=Fundicoccus ignavus TaxID=2664442 RepID=A0A844CDK6_9LACT|nr:DNA internalization-related competence protein ComEC/Rec2 [Fundicoccus ignavus]MRJ48477.1 DNA internalization-related competence protein ComEC/Rec2 [Fundicoccus ignavus]
MKHLLAQQQFYWSFIFLWLMVGLQLLFSPHWLGFICLALFGIRLLYLKNGTWKWVTILSLLVLALTLRQMKYLDNVASLTFTEADTNYTIVFSPLSVSLDSEKLTGTARLLHSENVKESIPIQVYYRLPEDFQVNSRLIDSQTVWQVKGKISKPDSARNFSVFDYQDYLLKQQIVWEMDITEIFSINEIAPITVKEKMQVWRANITKPFRVLEDFSWVAVHNKLLLNISSSAYKTLREDFLILGVVHYFAISGFHLNYIRKWLRYSLLRIGIMIELVEIFLLVLLLFYAWLIQWPAGVIRSLAAYYGRRLCRYFDLPFSSLDTLAIVGILMLIIHPLYSQMLGFQLSFLLSYVIHFYFSARKMDEGFQQQIEFSLTCLIFSWPLLIYSNAEWNWVQLVIVLVFGLIFDRILMPSMCMTTLIIYLSHVFGSFEVVLARLSLIFNRIWSQLIPIDFLKWTTLIIGSISVSQLLMLYAGASCWLWCLKRKRLLKAYVSVLIVYLILVLSSNFNFNTTLIVLDVGQGDALLYQPAFSRDTWLIDTGGRINFNDEGISLDTAAAQAQLLPALKALGVRRLKGVVVTHPDIDHAGNLLALSQEIDIEYLFINNYTLKSSLWKQIKPHLNSNIKMNVLENGQVYQVEATNFSILALEEHVTYYQEDQSNDSSLICYIKLGALSFLNLGDLSIEGERRLITAYPNLTADIIKVAHHGSNTSTSELLLEQLRPQLALISAGENNRYGHPHAEVLQRLQFFNIPTLATNDVGAIKITYNPIWGYSITTALEME